MMTQLRLGDEFVEYITEDAVHMTTDPEKGAWFNWPDSAYRAEVIALKHLKAGRVKR